jgi:hypothetical protein
MRPRIASPESVELDKKPRAGLAAVKWAKSCSARVEISVTVVAPANLSCESAQRADTCCECRDAGFAAKASIGSYSLITKSTAYRRSGCR